MTEQQGVGPVNGIVALGVGEWEFEAGFLDPLLKAGVHVVDRATVLRITAAKVAIETVDRDRQTIEVEALQGLADLLIEVAMEPRAPAGGEFDAKAVVKDVNTGRILVYVSSPRMGSETQPHRQYIATPRGFEPQDMAPPPPPIRDVGFQLATIMMIVLAEQWK
jgi:hypothetical protein